jgi:chemotaxis protein MotB
MSGAHMNSPATHGYPYHDSTAAADHDPAEDRDNGWLIGFVDILTLLVTLLVLMLAISHSPRHDKPRRDGIVTQPRPVAKQPAAPARVSAGAPRPPKPANIAMTKPAQAPTAKPAAPPLAKSVQPPKVQTAQTPPPARPTVTPKPVPGLTLPEDLKGAVDVVATATQVNLVIKDDVLYDVGSAELKPSGRAVLDKIARVLNQNGYPVSVEGHTDNTPIHTARFPSNWELSTTRATNVTRYLIQRGVAKDRLSAVGYADTRPLAGNDSAAGRARNRRVSLVVHIKKLAAHSSPPPIGDNKLQQPAPDASATGATDPARSKLLI